MPRPTYPIPYDPHFLGSGIVVPLPEPSQKLLEQLAVVGGSHVLDYIHFSLAMNKVRHTAVFSACNIDGSRVVKGAGGSKTWKLDERLGNYQLGPEAYNGTAWDKGHLTKREDVVWGTPKEARDANDATFYYANAAPQHGNFNRDEWKALEDWFFGWAHEEQYRLNVITGPVMKNKDRRLSEGDPQLERAIRTEILDDEHIYIPAVFWKIIAVRNKDTDDLSAAAFAMRQTDMWEDLAGHQLLRLTVHQVSVDAISRWTGLDFGPLHDADVLHIDEDRSVFARTEGGEAIWPIINAPEDIIAPPTDSRMRSLRTTGARVSASASQSDCGCGDKEVDVRAALESLTRDVALLTETVAASLPPDGDRSIPVGGNETPHAADATPSVEEILDRVRFDPQSAAVVRIVGGQEVPAGDFLSTCCLGSFNQFFCTGILIHPQVVVTAAHCTSNLTRAFFGGPRIPPGSGTIIRVKSAIVHPKYNKLALVRNDINVLILNEVATITPTPIATTAEIGAATNVELVGFGYNDGVAKLGFGVKRHVNVPMAAVRSSDAQDFSAAEKALGFSSHHEFVAGRKLLGKDSCNGDSGGPAFIDVGGSWKVAGVTSRATKEATKKVPCGSGGIYVRLDQYREWIAEVVAPFGIQL